MRALYWANCPGVTAGRYVGVTAWAERFEGERTRASRMIQNTAFGKLDLSTRFRV